MGGRGGSARSSAEMIPETQAPEAASTATPSGEIPIEVFRGAFLEALYDPDEFSNRWLGGNEPGGLRRNINEGSDLVSLSALRDALDRQGVSWASAEKEIVRLVRAGRAMLSPITAQMHMTQKHRDTFIRLGNEDKRLFRLTGR